MMKRMRRETEKRTKDEFGDSNVFSLSFSCLVKVEGRHKGKLN